MHCPKWPSGVGLFEFIVKKSNDSPAFSARHGQQSATGCCEPETLRSLHEACTYRCFKNCRTASLISSVTALPDLRFNFHA